MALQRMATQLRTLAFARSEECGFWKSTIDCLARYRSHRIYSRLDRNVTPIQEDPADGRALWRIPNGQLWAPRPERWTLVSNLAEQERGFYGKGVRGIRDGDVVLDCGANLGTFTSHALTMGAQLVVAIEPGPETAGCLRKSFAHEPRVVIEASGVWDENCTLALNQSSVTSAANTFVLPLEQQQGRSTVPVRTIDSIVESLSLARIDFIKMDIEGAECRALSGGRRTIHAWKPRLAICTYHLPNDPANIAGIVRSIRADYHIQYGFREEVRGRITPRVLHCW